MIEGWFGMRLNNYFFLIKDSYFKLSILLHIIPRSIDFIKLSTPLLNGNFQDAFIYFSIKNIHFLSSFFKKSLFFKLNLLGDICVTDLLSSPSRFKISYNILSLVFKSRLLLTSFLTESMFINSINFIFKSST